MLAPLLARLHDGRPLICHGAMGTMLQSADDEFNRAPEMVNLKQPDEVREVHRAYLAAGAEVLGTFTFGANPVKLRRAGLADQLHALNAAAARLACEAAVGEAYVAGSIGPTGEILEPYGDLSAQDATAAYVLQARALAEAGVDFFWIKTMSDLAEVRACVAGIRLVSDLPIICSLAFGVGGRTMMGVSPAQAALALSALGLAGIGANCGLGPVEMESVLAEMHVACPEARLIAQPNAGLPSLEGGDTVYKVGPAAFSACTRRFAARGAKFIGGCCGSTPAHIAAMAAALAE
ncbi:MAG: homocysteine S-methyltransferase family protein [Chloroflexota bacterium]